MKTTYWMRNDETSDMFSWRQLILDVTRWHIT